MNKRGISTVIFDMDGVLIDSEPIHLAIERQQFQALGLHLDLAEHQRFVGTSATNMWQTLVERYQLATSVEERVAEGIHLFLDYLQLHRATLCPIAGVTALIEELVAQGFKLVLASSASRQNIELVLDIFGFTEHFPHWVSGQDLPQSKPHPDIFWRAAQLATAAPAQCAVIEDATNGVIAAKAAGMYCVAFRNPNSGNQDLHLADLVIDALGPDLVAHLRSC